MLCHIGTSATVRAVLAFACVLTCGVWTTAFAQDKGQPAEDGHATVHPPIKRGALTLKRTLIDTENSGVSLSTSASAAFPTFGVSCPVTQTRGCTIKVEVSSQFWDIPSSSVAQINVAITGGLQVNPAGIVNVDSTTAGGLASVHTFQWMVTGINAGTSQTVSISFDVTSGTAVAGYRTATIDTFLN
jgi:hypothetical protein